MKKLFRCVLVLLLLAIPGGQAGSKPERQWRKGWIVKVNASLGERTFLRTSGQVDIQGTSETQGHIDGDGNINTHGTANAHGTISSTTVPVTRYDPLTFFTVEDNDTGIKYDLAIKPEERVKCPALAKALDDAFRQGRNTDPRYRDHFDNLLLKGILTACYPEPCRVPVTFAVNEFPNKKYGISGYQVIFQGKKAGKEFKLWALFTWKPSTHEEQEAEVSPEVQHAKSCTDLGHQEDQAIEKEDWEQVVSAGREELSVCKDLISRDGEITTLTDIALGLNRLGKPDEALPIARRCISLKPDAAQCFLQMGRSFEALGQPQDAIDSYRHVLAIGGYDRFTAGLVELAKQRLAVLEASR